MAEENEKEAEKRRCLSAEDKARIMSMILLEGESVSDVADEYRISPNKILTTCVSAGCSTTSPASWTASVARYLSGTFSRRWKG